MLIDCGMFQGAKEWRVRNWQPTPVPAAGIDAVILTHAHLDHCGWIPRLVREGFRGPVYATPSTIDLCGIILPDSGHLQEEDARFYNRHKKSKHDPALPLYTLAEAEDSLQHFHPVQFEETRQLSPEVSFRFVPAAHILGSAMVELTLNLNGQVQKAVVQRRHWPRARPEQRARQSGTRSGPTEGETADVLVMESTYGNRAAPHRRSQAETGRDHPPDGAARRQRDCARIRRRTHPEISLHDQRPDGVRADSASSGVLRQPDGDQGGRSLS